MEWATDFQAQILQLKICVAVLQRIEICLSGTNILHYSAFVALAFKEKK